MIYRYPAIIRRHDLESKDVMQELPSGKWVPSLPVGYPSFWSRVKCAWLVFTGRGDVLSYLA